MGKNVELLLSHYTGSTVLSFLCLSTNLSIDQVNFIACQFAALILSFILKNYVKDARTRLTYCLFVGIVICNFCFGIQTFHVIISAGLSYAVICRSRSTHMPWFVFAVSMLYLSWLHIRRQFIDSVNGYSLDITGPLMVLTQKVTSLAFAVSDGQKQKQDIKISELEKSHAISDIPSALEYWSFIFQFQSMLAGPLVFFKEYRQFIYYDRSPNSVYVVFKKLVSSMFFALLFLKAAPQYDIDYLKEDAFLNRTSFLYKLYYIFLATTFERAKYYHAWILSDAVCNASGLGYNSATRTWDLVTNVEALKFERGLNLKESLDEWNKGTMRWLRYVIYERVNPRIKTVATYATSAFWHGFYPGYYMTFFSGAIFTSTARSVRRHIRPMVVENRVAKMTYDFLTWFVTRMIVAYVSFTFVLLDLLPSLYVYMKLYFFFHVAAAGAMIAIPKVAKNISPPKIFHGPTVSIPGIENNRQRLQTRIIDSKRRIELVHNNASEKLLWKDENEITQMKLKTG